MLKLTLTASDNETIQDTFETDDLEAANAKARKWLMIESLTEAEWNTGFDGLQTATANNFAVHCQAID